MDFKTKYTNPKFHAAFTGENTFRNAIKNENNNALRNKKFNKTIKQTLEATDSYTLHKPTRKTKIYRRTYSKGIGDIFQIDLVDIHKHVSENDGFRYIVTIIDIFSKKAWAFKSKTKSGESLHSILKAFFRNNKPNYVCWDKGSEFYNKKVLTLLKKNGILHYSVTTRRKAAVVERFNRSLKTRMFRAFTSRGSNRWVDILDDLIKGYNNTKHSSIGMPPNKVNFQNEHIVRKKLYPAIIKRKYLLKPVFKVGDSVRVKTEKSVFQKSYEQSWSYHVYEISKVKLNTYPITYEIKDYSGNEINQTFYKEDLQKVDKSDNIWPINNILKQKTKNGKTSYLVNFIGYPEDLTDWIPQNQLFNNPAH